METQSILNNELIVNNLKKNVIGQVPKPDQNLLYS